MTASTLYSMPTCYKLLGIYIYCWPAVRARYALIAAVCLSIHCLSCVANRV